MSDAEKREKLIVIKKLEGLEKELKVSKLYLKPSFDSNICFQLLAYSESLTDQVNFQFKKLNEKKFATKIKVSCLMAMTPSWIFI